MNAVEPDEIARFITYLRSLGFSTGPGERVRALRLYRAFGRDPRDLRVRNMLAPVFARDADEQNRFYRAFDLFFQPRIAGSSVPAVVSAQPIPASSVSRTPARHIGLWVAGFLLAIGSALILVLVPEVVQLPDLPLSPQPLTDWIRESVTRTVIGARPCEGFECVTTGWRPLILFAPLPLWLLWQLLQKTAGFRKSAAAMRERKLTAPLEWPLRVEAPPLSPIVQRASQAAAAELARRLVAETAELDILATVYQTARQGGFPQPQFAWKQKAPEYLVLIEEQSRRDHFAAWLDSVVVNLERRGVRLERYHYRHTPQVCFRPGASIEVAFRQLLRRYPAHRILLFGEAEALSDPYSGRLAPWAREIQQHDERAWLTPAPPFEWRTAERRAGQWIRLIPARLSHLTGLAKGFEAPSTAIPLLDDVVGEYPLPPADLLSDDAEPDVLTLSTFVDADVFVWLCSCSLHVELDWPLTCRLALALSPDGTLLNERPILQLIRLQWFRQGRIPPQWRTALMRCLAPTEARKAREELLLWLEADDAPEGSFARREQSARISAHRYYLEPNDPKRNVAADVALSKLAQADIAADSMLVQLESDLRRGSADTPGARGGIVYYLYRYAALVSTALTAASIAVIGIGLSRLPVQEPRTVEDVRFVPPRASAPLPPSLPPGPDAPLPAPSSPAPSSPTPSPPTPSPPAPSPSAPSPPAPGLTTPRPPSQASTEKPAATAAPAATTTPAPAPKSTEVPAAAPPTVSAKPTQAPPSAQQKVDDDILLVLGEYSAGYTQRSAAAIRRVWPTMPPDVEQQLVRSFAQARSYEMRLSPCSISVQGLTASAQCTGTVSFVPNVGRASTASFSSTFTLRKSGDRWLVDNVTTRSP